MLDLKNNLNKENINNFFLNIVDEDKKEITKVTFAYDEIKKVVSLWLL